MNRQPPKLFLKFFQWFCHPGLVKPIEGDLMELYEERLMKSGKMKADLLFIKDVIVLFRKDIIKPPSGTYRLTNYGMLKHNLLISFRSFLRYKSTFLINLLGLSSGLAASLLIYLWVYDEINTDRFSEVDSERHVQVIHSYPTSGSMYTNASGFTPNPLFEALAEYVPEVEYSFPVLAHPNYQGVLSNGERHIRAKYQFIGKGYFNVFPGNFLHGDKFNILGDKSEIAISDKMAKSLFNNPEDAIGKLIELKDEYYGGSYLVSGVFKSNATESAEYDILFSYDLFREADLMQWYNGGTQAHLVLKEGVGVAEFNEKIKHFMAKVYKDSKELLYAQPYPERYLYGNYENGVPVGGRIAYVKLFSIIALFVLVIACINYMNFSTAKATRRIKEIGVKKAIGAGRKTLVYQYFGESLVMAFISLLIALGLVLLLLPQFNHITGKQLTLTLEPSIILAILLITIVTGVVSGIYPALHLSGFHPIEALKGKLKLDASGLIVRKALVVFQFTITAILIVSVLVIYKQVEFIQTKNLGYNKDHIISFPKEGKLKEDFQAFLTELKSIPSVTNASQMYGDLPGRISFSQGYKWEGMGEEDKRLRFYRIQGGYDLIDLLGIQLKDGRNFSREFATDKDAIILNETAVNMTSLKNPVGEKFGNFNPNAPTKTVVGVVENFHFHSLQEEVKPFFFSLSEKGNNFLVKFQPGTEKSTIEKIEKLYEEFNEGYPFDFKFLDDNYQKVYAAEERITVLSKYFAGIAITISCLGLLALTAFSTQRRFKEIAIRKILGSSSTEIVRLLSRDFMILVFIAILLALPISYVLMRSWLNDFAYRISLEPIYFILGGVLMVFVAWLTIVSQTAKSANINVSESIRAND